MSVNGVEKYTYTYGTDNNLTSKHDIAENITTTYVKNTDSSTTVTVTKVQTGTVIDTYTISSDSKVFSDTIGTTTYGRTTNTDGTSDSFKTNSVESYVKTYTKDTAGKVTEENISDAGGTILTTIPTVLMAR